MRKDGSVVSAREELDATPPASFVRVRNALVARLRAAGRAREADELARRRRPSPVLWLVNRLALADSAGITALLEAAEELRDAYLRDPRAIPDATTHHRAALQRLTSRVETILGATGARPSADVLRRVHATLGAAAADRRQHPLLRQGRLAEEIEPGGFEVLGGAPVRHLAFVRLPGAPEPRADRVKGVMTTRAEQEAVQRQAQAERRRERRPAAEARKREREVARDSRQAERLRERLRQVEERIERTQRSVRSAAPLPGQGSRAAAPPRPASPPRA